MIINNIKKTIDDTPVEIKINDLRPTLFPINWGKIDWIGENRGVIDNIDRYIINENATIIFWKDGIKTVSKVDKNDEFDKELGFMLAVFRYLTQEEFNEEYSKTEVRKILDCVKDDKLKDFLFIFFNKYTFQDTNKSRKYLNELKTEKSKKKNKKENIIDLINSMYEEPQMTKKVFSLEKYKEWYKEEYGVEYIETKFDWVNQCIDLTKEECNEKGWCVGGEWMVEVNE